jgi:hypothetical protein
MAIEELNPYSSLPEESFISFLRRRGLEKYTEQHVHFESRLISKATTSKVVRTLEERPQNCGPTHRASPRTRLELVLAR